MNTDYTDEREELNTQDMLQDGFLKELSKKNSKLATQIKQAVPSEGTQQAQASIKPKGYNTEGLINELFDLRDNLISTFSTVNHNTITAQSISTSINKAGSCLRELGAEVDDFNPLDHISGLNSPDLVDNANKVIAMTKQCYDAGVGSIKEAVIQDNGKTIAIAFEGKSEDVSYIANGTIRTASSWTGNEAIDYIYTPGSGKMSVKAFEGSGWSDKSDDYGISWELEESVDDGEKKVEKSSGVKEEESQEAQNKISVNIDEDITDFPIDEN